MEENVVNPSPTNETIQHTVVDEWKSDPDGSSFNNDSNVPNISEKLDNATISDNTVTENTNSEQKQESNNDFTFNSSSDNTWVNHYEPKNPQGNKDYSRNYKGQGRFHKSNHGNNSFEKSSSYDPTSNSFENNRGNRGRGRGRGRGLYKKPDNENESFEDGNNSSHNNYESHRGRGRGYHRARGGRFREKSNDGWHGNFENGHRKKENDKAAGPKAEYIPPDIESEETIAGIEAGLNFDKYNTIEVKVSGTDPPKCLTSFNSSGLRNILLDNLSDHNFCTPTPVQNYAIPIIMAGRDLMASAQTGSGKTVS